MQLDQGATQIATTGAKTAGLAWATFEYQLTALEVAAITDYTDLRFHFLPTVGAGETVRVKWAELFVDEPTTNYRSIGFGTAADYSSPVDSTVEPFPGTNLVIGTLTQWQTWNRGRGDVITISGTDYTVLAVESNTQLRLTTNFTGGAGPLQSYTIRRQFTGATAELALVTWEDCIDGLAACSTTSSLVVDDRREFGILYEDSVFVLTATREIRGSTTDALHSIPLTADGVNSYNGTPGDGVIVDSNLDPNRWSLRVRDIR